MSPLSKANAISFSIASTIVYYLWDAVPVLPMSYSVISFCVSLVLSYTFYKLIFLIVLSVSKYMPLLKRFLLGRTYLEGFWIGYFTVDGKTEYYYEFFEQDLETISIKGVSFNENKEYTGGWTVLQPNLIISESKITYYYEMNTSDASTITLGYSRGTLHWKNGGKVYKITGFAVDSYSRNNQPYLSIKVSNDRPSEAWIQQNFWSEIMKLQNESL